MTSRVERGFTLLELLLVLALIAAITALAIPALRGPLENARLRTAADTLRAAFTRARLDATRAGKIRLFRYELGGARYRVMDWPATESQPLDEKWQTLPDGVVFLGGEAQEDSRQLDFSAAPAANAVDEIDFGPALVFYPDGTTSTGQLTLKNQRDRAVTIRLRGLTASVRVGEVESLAEATP